MVQQKTRKFLDSGTRKQDLTFLVFFSLSGLDDSHFDIRIASEEDNAKITGYDNNAVVPFGLLSPVPIIVSAPIVPLRFFWMGGGHVHLKLRTTVADFCKALNPIVADISQPRTSTDPEP